MNVITNPPYGGDKIVQSDTQIKKKKIKEYIKKELLTLKDELKIKTRLRQIKKIEEEIKQEKKDSDKTKVSIEMCSQRIIKYAKDNKLSGNDKESASLILIMDLLDVNGTAIGVLKEGVINNKTYKDLRKCLLENFNVREIISVPQDQFENTSTKTSIVIFDNTKEKTSKVKFYDLVIQRYKDDKFEEIGNEIVLTENKDDICGISDNLISISTKNEILMNEIYSLNGKDYNKKDIVVGNDYNLIKLGDICEFKNGTNITKDKLIKGEYAVIGGGQSPLGYHNINNVDENTILISKDGAYAGFVSKYDKKVFVSNHGIYISKIKENINKDYIYHILKSVMQQNLYNLQKGSAQPGVNKADIEKLKIPIPKSRNQDFSIPFYPDYTSL
jgi:restriction endonuclease S subunit